MEFFWFATIRCSIGEEDSRNYRDSIGDLCPSMPEQRYVWRKDRPECEDRLPKKSLSSSDELGVARGLPWLNCLPVPMPGLPSSR